MAHTYPMNSTKVTTSNGRIPFPSSLPALCERIKEQARELDILIKSTAPRALADLSLEKGTEKPQALSFALRDPEDEADARAILRMLDALKRLAALHRDGSALEMQAPEGTEPKTAKRENHSRERLLQAAIFSHLGEGMIVLDENEKIFLVNNRARDILGFGEKEKLHGQKYENRLRLQNRGGDPLDPEKNPVNKAILSHEPVRVLLMDDLYCLKKDGTPFPITLTASPIVFNNSKKIAGTVITFNDITQEKKMDEIKSDFIYIASHQLRTPLTVSTLHTEMLLAGHGGELTKDQREFLTEIHFYNKKMAQLLSVFMTVSKIELGTFALQEKPTDLRLTLDDVLHELNTQIKNKKLVVTKEYIDALGMVSTDPEFIRIVFQNLVSNAVKYTPHEGIIRLSICKKNGGVEIIVGDSGCGIPREEQTQVFTKLYRGSNTKNHRWESNGLGLYIVKSIIDKCGGTISFKSEENKGTTFTIFLPLKETDSVMMA
jgi:two-component system phosphate regulon sensor histidine kinase PhoR